MTNKIKSPAHAEMMRQFHCCPILNVVFTFLFSLITICFASGQTAAVELPKEKQTTIGLYVTAKQAYEKWKADPEKIKVLDVRTLEEWLFVGHAPMAWNIPVVLQSYHWDSSKQKFPMKPNPDFMTLVKKLFMPNDIIMVTCRSGGRSAMAVNMMAQAGYKNTYNIIDGFEGDAIKDPESVFFGQHMKNGWKNSGLPWTYEVNPDKVTKAKEN